VTAETPLLLGMGVFSMHDHGYAPPDETFAFKLDPEM